MSMSISENSLKKLFPVLAKDLLFGVNGGLFLLMVTRTVAGSDQQSNISCNVCSMC